MFIFIVAEPWLPESQNMEDSFAQISVGVASTQSSNEAFGSCGAGSVRNVDTAAEGTPSATVVYS